jgi:Uma2 family endonuclease
MSRITGDIDRMSVEEYLRVEESADVRHEYVGGDVHALAGASKRHNRVALNIGRALDEASRGRPCRVYMSDVKLRAADDLYYYPDVMVACGPEGADPFVEEAPCVLVEITSPTTEAIDRREKLLVYRRIEGLRSYLIVDQASRRVDRHWRDDEGVWRHEVVGGTGRVNVPCPEVELRLDTIYERAGV